MINETKEDAIRTLRELLSERGIELSDGEVEDFGIKGGETNAELDEMAHDYWSDLRSDIAESKNRQYEEDNDEQAYYNEQNH